MKNCKPQRDEIYLCTYRLLSIDPKISLSGSLFFTKFCRSDEQLSKCVYEAQFVRKNDSVAGAMNKDTSFFRDDVVVKSQICCMLLQNMHMLMKNKSFLFRHH